MYLLFEMFPSLLTCIFCALSFVQILPYQIVVFEDDIDLVYNWVSHIYLKPRHARTDETLQTFVLD